jgi:hypothetical protein
VEVEVEVVHQVVVLQGEVQEVLLEVQVAVVVVVGQEVDDEICFTMAFDRTM